MNGKKAKLLRKYARTSATSHNECDPKFKNRRLGQFSLKRLHKFYKTLYKSTPSFERNIFNIKKPISVVS
jgi:hypothetical protein